MAFKENRPKKLLLILLDGVRWDYEKKFNMKSLQRIREIGFSVDMLQPCYPSMSAPNYYSATTGKHPGNHGLINNTMFEEEKNIEFRAFVNPPDPICLDEMWWSEAEPLWISATKSSLRVHMYRWFGSTVARNDVVPVLSSEYIDGYPICHMQNDLLKALDLFVNDSSDFIGFYVGATDDAGHFHGVESEITEKTCRIVDENLLELLDILDTKKNKYDNLLKDEVNVVIFSDHGMTQLNSEKTVNIYQILSKIEHLNVHKREDIPERFHYGQHPRVGDIFAYTDLPYVFYNPEKKLNGNHGFDNAEKDMQGIFYAFGPDIIENGKTTKASMVDIYPLLCQLLKIKIFDCDSESEALLAALK
ncbi:DgyrCDS11057 [Dimorphilus gyrociliatus]|uniref:glycerophosphocholine cholinephosphodiesterase n=1 Tax=Dimorphilus gyrociliatus TaxID=2664684 RepID=A0A7I8W282_9ANNE|nr:DgyrCDS11057 [Dimorphilus gyrociliatus]